MSNSQLPAKARPATTSTTINSHARAAHRVLLGSVDIFVQAGRFRDARSVLMTAIEVAFRAKFVEITGKTESGAVGASRYAKRLRSVGGIDRRAYQQFIEMVQDMGPYTAVHIRRLANFARHVHAAVYGESKGGSQS